jgi:Double zinc ribbon
MTCPACSTPSTGGRFCSSCGAPLEGALCPACRSALTTGAKFCHRCGTAVGAAPGPDPRTASTVPWAVASIALIALIALVAGRNFGAHKQQQSDEDAAAAPAAAPGPAAGPQADGGRAPDISAMSPAERADRLYDRVMRYHSEGKDDSAQTFAPMAMAAYQMIDTLTLDQRYDLGRIGEVIGLPDVARAQADTILSLDSTHLLGLALAARAATLAKQGHAAEGYYRRLLAALPAERKKNLPEYSRHSADIDAAVAEARKQRA